MKRVLQILALPLFAFLATCVYWAPALIHGLDSGKQTLSIDDLLAGKRPEGTHNVEITGGKAFMDVYVTSDLRKRDPNNYGTTRSTGDVTLYAPLMPRDWDKTGKVKVLMAVRYGSVDQSMLENGGLGHRSLTGASADTPATIGGVVRDVLWEGLPDEDKVSSAFAQGGIDLADKPLVISVGKAAKSNMTFALVGIGGITLFAFLLSLATVGRKRATSPAQTEAKA